MTPQKPTFQKFQTFGKLSNNLMKKLLFFLIIFIGIACENTSQKSLQETKDTTKTNAITYTNMATSFMEVSNFNLTTIKNTLDTLQLSPQTTQQIASFIAKKLKMRYGRVVVKETNLETFFNAIIDSLKGLKKSDLGSLYHARLDLSTEQLTNKQGSIINKLSIFSVLNEIPRKNGTQGKLLAMGYPIEIQVIYTKTNIPLLWIDEKELVYLSEHTEMTKEQVKTAIENIFGHKVITEKSNKVTNSNTILAEFGVVSLKILSNFKNEKTTLTIQKKIGLSIGIFNFGKPIKELLQKH